MSGVHEKTTDHEEDRCEEDLRERDGARWDGPGTTEEDQQGHRCSRAVVTRGRPRRPGGALPESVVVAMADLAETAREGLLALAVGTGLQVMPSGRPRRTHPAPSSPDRVRSADGCTELAVASYELFSPTETRDGWPWSG